MPAALVGIVNLTPDSFSDGGRFADASAALDAMARMIEEGARVIDIGAESTRPGAMPISPKEEWQRLEPVLSALHRVKKPGIAFSVDTRHGETVQRAIGCGADWINDVTGFSSAAMVAAVKNSDCKLVMMHSLGAPADKSVTLPAGCDVVETLLEWAKKRIADLEQQGVSKNRIIFDPGVGFGKTAAQSLAIVRGINRFHALGLPLLVGHSRKSFLEQWAANRDDATLTASLYLAGQGTQYLRVHDVARHAAMLNVWEAIADDTRQSGHRRTA